MGVGGGAEYTSAMPLGDVFQDNVTLTVSFLKEIFNRTGGEFYSCWKTRTLIVLTSSPEQMWMV